MRGYITFSEGFGYPFLSPFRAIRIPVSEKLGRSLLDTESPTGTLAPQTCARVGDKRLSSVRYIGYLEVKEKKSGWGYLDKYRQDRNNPIVEKISAKPARNA